MRAKPLLGLSVSMIVGFACGSSDDAKHDTPLAFHEIGRGDIGPAGGTVTAGAVTIEIPSGALTQQRTIIINEADPNARALPTDTQIAGGLYVLQPDDVTFAVPVTVTVQVDQAKKRSDGKGALVLFRGAVSGATSWTPQGAIDTSSNVITGKTTHFSVWAPTAAAESYCYALQWSPIDLGHDPTRPDILPGMDAKVPKDGDRAVLCAGTAPDKGPPYECHCAGSDVSLATFARLPPDDFVTAMAVQCGATPCAPKPTYACDLGLQCDATSCSTARDPRILCNGTSCSCTTGQTFTIANPKPSNDELVTAWLANCTGASCENAGTDPNLDYVCQGGAAKFDEGSGSCFQETITCRDNHVYRIECVNTSVRNVDNCKCLIDGKVTRENVSVTCNEGAWACDWPKLQGVPPQPTKVCPIITSGPKNELPPGQAPPPGYQPEGCVVHPAGTCKDGHVYTAECTTPGTVSPCSCKVDGVEVKTVNSSCGDDTAVACGWPSSK